MNLTNDVFLHDSVPVLVYYDAATEVTPRNRPPQKSAFGSRRPKSSIGKRLTSRLGFMNRSSVSKNQPNCHRTASCCSSQKGSLPLKATMSEQTLTSLLSKKKLNHTLTSALKPHTSCTPVPVAWVGITISISPTIYTQLCSHLSGPSPFASMRFSPFASSHATATNPPCVAAAAT